MRARALGISGVNFCEGIRFWEVNFDIPNFIRESPPRVEKT